MPRVPTSNRVPINNNENLLIQSSDISSVSWQKTNASWLPNQIANPIDGAITAGAMVDNAVNNVHFFRQVDPPALVAAVNTVVTQSIFAKAGSKNFLAIGANSGGGLVYYNLANGTIDSPQQGAGFIEPYGNGWYRCWYPFYLTNPRPAYYPAIANLTASYAGDADAALYLYGPMINHGRYPVLPTFDTVSVTTPVRSRLFSINFTINSNTFSQWTQTNSTITSNAVPDPLTGEMTASILNDDTTNGLHSIQNTTAAQYIQNAPSTISIFAKAAPGSTAPMLEIPTLTGGIATFDLLNGTVAGVTTDITSATMRSVGDGWYQCIVVKNASTGLTYAMRLNASTGHGSSIYIGTGNPCLYLARAQLVQGDRSGDLLSTALAPIGVGTNATGHPDSTAISVRSTSNRTTIT